MELFHTILAIVALILSSAVVSSAEISLASSRKLKLQSLANKGDVRALQVLKLQRASWSFYYGGSNFVEYGGDFGWGN